MPRKLVTDLPPQATFMHAILRHLLTYPDGDERNSIFEAMPVLLNLSDIQRSERLANLPHLRYRYRTGWGLSGLKAAGYVESAGHGKWRITHRGRELIARYPDGWDESVARQLRQEGRREHHGEAVTPTKEVVAEPSAHESPEERIDAAVTEINTSVAADLLERILQAPPTFFEQLVLDLLHALGYGASVDDLERVGGARDGGIDGVISLDTLGFEKVYVQAKRWQGAVGRPEVQAFYGALVAKRARKGVLITSSAFTREARDYGAEVRDRVVLIDGPRLTSLMIAHGVGVTHHRVIRLPRVDADYFAYE